MVRSRDMLICSLLLGVQAVWAAPPKAAGSAGNSRSPGSGATAMGVSSATNGQRTLKGRFLHITDFHPDPFYKTYASTTSDAACHRERGPAGIYGAETTGCDSPFALINQTFRWINDNLKNEIDFIVWTGDSARHDNDDAIPRTQKQVIEQNEYMVSKFTEVFGQNGHGGGTNAFAIPIVPTFGNNDILPHNIFTSGPNRWTTKYLDIWRGFIPEAQRHQFQQGGWFSVEVIPGKLATISLNTIYFFTSNSAVDGCAKKHEPGYEHMEWLRIQLQLLRERGMKAILMGHVPPARVDGKESWDETCWQKYALFERQFRDVIVGNLFGHMNIDHFMLQDFESIEKDTENGHMGVSVRSATSGNEVELFEDGEVTVASATDYLLNLRQAWAQLPAPPVKSNKKLRTKSSKDRKEERKKYLEKIGGQYAERYAVTHVAPSIVPNYFPTLRIIEYNITGLENFDVSTGSSSLPIVDASAGQMPIAATDYEDDEDYVRHLETVQRMKHRGKKDKKKRKYKFEVPDGPSKTAPPGPAYSPQTLTWTRYVQYFANLTRINNDFVDSPLNAVVVQDTSANEFAVSTIFGFEIGPDGKIKQKRWNEGKHKKHQGKQPRPEPHPNEFVFEVEYDTKKDKGFSDLTVRRWVEYARKIGSGESKSKFVDVEEEEVVNEHLGEDEYDAKKGKKHNKGKKGKHHKKHEMSKEWFTFAKRAFVGTLDPHEIQELFGSASATESLEGAQEVMEL
ncbi:endopolyphosphatase [Pyrenophora tritici-repentis]|nr:Endopolyphosphatase [Pyrenophora tritici-repentis]KAI0606255.1 Endopolyphosphatase [Pyrenophora tritici-repentis]KAI1527841.1 endopolyphosphatase [Pyrenophora tritici-repentis]KAI1596840.1 endopolyphosphatase [Pyrenophora tritici-repentis]PZC91167.1 hypothetical protein A1F95_08964 [Pyrenophora tritici-repentis]